MKDKQKASEKNFDMKLNERDAEAGMFNLKADNGKAETKIEFYKRIQAWRRENRTQEKDSGKRCEGNSA